LAAVMLALFALGITPKIAVHELVARHTDRHLALGSLKTDLLTRAGFFCRVDNLVVDLSFLLFSVDLRLRVLRGYCREYDQRAKDQYYSFECFQFGLRGPPRMI